MICKACDKVCDNLHGDIPHLVFDSFEVGGLSTYVHNPKKVDFNDYFEQILSFPTLENIGDIMKPKRFMYNCREMIISALNKGDLVLFVPYIIDFVYTKEDYTIEELIQYKLVKRIDTLNNHKILYQTQFNNYFLKMLYKDDKYNQNNTYQTENFLKTHIFNYDEVFCGFYKGLPIISSLGERTFDSWNLLCARMYLKGYDDNWNESKNAFELIKNNYDLYKKLYERGRFEFTTGIIWTANSIEYYLGTRGYE